MSTIMWSLTFFIFTVSKKIATFKFLPRTNTRPAVQRYTDHYIDSHSSHESKLNVYSQWRYSARSPPLQNWNKPKRKPIIPLYPSRQIVQIMTHLLTLESTLLDFTVKLKVCISLCSVTAFTCYCDGNNNACKILCNPWRLLNSVCD